MTARSPKPSRTGRVRVSSRFEIQERDIDVLTLVGLCGAMSTSQAARALFPSEDRARRRLRRLFDAGFINVAVTGANSPNLVSLTKRGLRLAESTRPDLEGRLRLAGPIQMSTLTHRLMVVDARLYAAALGEKRGSPLVRWANAGGALAAEIGLADWHIEPDGLAEFATPEGAVFVAVEADCGTEPVKSVIGDKLARYLGAAEHGVIDALWFVVLSEARRTTITESLASHGLEEFGRVFLVDEVNARPVREPTEVGGAAGGRARGPNTPATAIARNRERRGFPKTRLAADRRVDRRGSARTGRG
ncbi:MAG: replication-relaxation family protein [Patescibacteria group bacterium]